MKKLLLLLFIPLCNFIFAQTNVSGFINVNTTWTVAGSPYIVVGNALLSQGYTLTIDPGVVVKFNSQKALQIDGEMIAIGTPVNRITFTSNQPSPAPGDWAKLHFSSYCTPATYDSQGNYLSGTIMKYCDVHYAGDLDYGEIHIESAMPYISQCNIQYSAHDGIYCSGSTFVLDSSLVSDNANYGLYFNNYSQNSCGLVINGDTMQSNSWGGLFLGTNSSNCITEVKNCYFNSNDRYGAIRDSAAFEKVNIHDNYFLYNTAIYDGIISFDNNGFTPYRGITIDNNYFSGNNSRNYTIYTVGTNGTFGTFVKIRKNYFINNVSTTQGIIGFNPEPIYLDTISCNSFIHNQTHGAIIEMRNNVSFSSNGGSGAIQHNIFDGNSNLANNGTGILEVSKQSTYGILDFSNNVIQNNSTIGSGSLCNIVALLTDSIQMLRIHHNEFRNNSTSKIISLTGPLINNSDPDFMYFKHNNFLDSSTIFTLYDSIPYGSPNIKADSNYWGSTNTQHIDSIIYDYFDYAGQSVVYYMPISMELNSIDTVCRVPCFVGVDSITNVACYNYANGSVQLITAGTSPYSYSWSPSGGNGPTASNLAAGYYTCIVTDSVGCVTSTTVHITQPAGIFVIMDNPTNVSCYGGNNGCGSIDYIDGGSPPYSYYWAPSGNTTPQACSLSAGTYTLSITESNGCVTTETVTITQPATQLTVTSSVLNNVSCFGGNTGKATASGGGGSPSYGYHWSPSGGNSSTTNNIPAGAYTVTVTDSHGCSITSTQTITQPPALIDSVIATGASPPACTDGSAYADVSGGVPPYSYLWTPSGGNSPSVTNLVPGNYTCCITDANGCTKCKSDSVACPTGILELDNIKGFQIYPNPTHSILNVECRMQNAELKMYDMTGRIVLEETLHSPLSTINCPLSTGLYLVRVEAGDIVWQEKVVVE